MDVEMLDTIEFQLGTQASLAPDWEFGRPPIDEANASTPRILEEVLDQTLPVQSMDVHDLTLINNPESVTISQEVRIEPDQPRRIGRTEWETHRQVIETQHSSKTLKELRELMSIEHGFLASTQQWKKKLGEWGLSKNLKPREVKFIQKKTRRRQLEEHKETQFTNNKQPVPMDKVRRHLQNPPHDPPSPTGSTPSGISYNTYRPSIPIAATLYTPQVLYQEELPRSRTATPSIGSIEFGPMIPAFWEGHDSNYFLALAQEAASYARDNDYVKARPAFIEAIDGLGALLRPVHVKTVATLIDFVNVASENDDQATAIEKLHRSYHAHINLLGEGDKRTWRSLARLGQAYMDAGEVYQAYHMLTNARQGLLSTMAADDPNVVFHATKDLVRRVALVLQYQGDFDEAEKEFLNLVSQASDADSPYDLVFYKMDLVILYIGPREGRLFAQQYSQQAENLLLDILRTDVLEYRLSPNYIVTLTRLRYFYQNTHQDTKLIKCLQDFEKELEDPHWSNTLDLYNAWVIDMGMGFYYGYLGQFEEAEWWYNHFKSEVEGSNPRSTWEISYLIDHSRHYISRGRKDTARELLEKARDIASELLPQDHKLHAFVKEFMEIGRKNWSICPVCLCDQSRGFCDNGHNNDIQRCCGHPKNLPRGINGWNRMREKITTSEMSEGVALDSE